MQEEGHMKELHAGGGPHEGVTCRRNGTGKGYMQEEGHMKGLHAGGEAHEGVACRRRGTTFIKLTIFTVFIKTMLFHPSFPPFIFHPPSVSFDISTLGPAAG